MASSRNRKAVEIPLPLYDALNGVAGKNRDTLARLVTHALWEWMKQHHPAEAPKNPYLTEQQQADYWRHTGRGTVKSDGYRRF